MGCSGTASYVQTVNGKKYKGVASVSVSDKIGLSPASQEATLRMLAIGGLTGTIGGYTSLVGSDFDYKTTNLDYYNETATGQTVVCDVDVILEYLGTSNNYSKYAQFSLKNITPGDHATGISSAIQAASYSIFGSSVSGTWHAVKSVTITAKLSE